MKKCKKIELLTYCSLGLMLGTTLTSCNHQNSEASYAANDPIIKNIDSTVSPG